MEIPILTGKEVVYKNDKIFTVTDFDGKNDRLVLNDGKTGYNLTTAIERGTLRFTDENIQKTVLRYINERKLIVTPPPHIPPTLAKDWWIKEGIRLFQNSGSPKIITHNYTSVYSTLSKGLAYEKAAREVYEHCISNLGFKRYYLGNFLPRQLLFAANATKEGYSVWMIPNSSFTGKTSGTWANVIEGDGKKIYELYKEPVFSRPDIRLAFAKQGDGYYVFLGVYQHEKREKIDEVIDDVILDHVDIHTRISETYPF